MALLERRNFLSRLKSTKAMFDSDRHFSLLFVFAVTSTALATLTACLKSTLLAERSITINFEITLINFWNLDGSHSENLIIELETNRI